MHIPVPDTQHIESRSKTASSQPSNNIGRAPCSKSRVALRELRSFANDVDDDINGLRKLHSPLDLFPSPSSELPRNPVGEAQTSYIPYSHAKFRVGTDG